MPPMGTQQGEPRIVTAPPRHQGVREALRTVFVAPDGLPADLVKLLNKLS